MFCYDAQNHLGDNDNNVTLRRCHLWVSLGRNLQSFLLTIGEFECFQYLDRDTESRKFTVSRGWFCWLCL